MRMTWLHLLSLVLTAYVVAPAAAVDPGAEVTDTVTELREALSDAPPELRADDAEFREAVRAVAERDAARKEAQAAQEAQAEQQRQMRRFQIEVGRLKNETQLATRRAEQARLQAEEAKLAARKEREQRREAERAMREARRPDYPPPLVPANHPQLRPNWHDWPRPSRPGGNAYSAVYEPAVSRDQRDLLGTAFELERIAHELEVGGSVRESDIVRRAAKELREQHRAANGDRKAEQRREKNRRRPRETEAPRGGSRGFGGGGEPWGGGGRNRDGRYDTGRGEEANRSAGRRRQPRITGGPTEPPPE